MTSGLERTTTVKERGRTRVPNCWIWRRAETETVWSRWWRGEILIDVFFLSYGTGHAEVADTAYAHLIDKDVLELEICVNETHLLVKITYTTDDLAEHHACVVMGQCGTTVALENVVERASRTEKHEEKVSVRGVDRVE